MVQRLLLATRVKRSRGAERTRVQSRVPRRVYTCLASGGVAPRDPIADNNVTRDLFTIQPL